MTASEVKAYLIERHRASLGDIAVHFGSAPDAARQALQPWLDKGRVRRLDVESACKDAKCCGCGHKQADPVYEWVG